MRSSSIAAVAFSVWLAASLVAQTPAKRPLSVDDIYRMQDVGNAQTSPDGKWIAYTVTSMDRESDKRVSSIWMVNWEGTQDVRLTYGQESASSPRWSPDGRYLAFLSSRPPGDKTELWLLDRRGGEARQLTNVKEDLSGYAWSPDGKRLVLEMSPGDRDDSAAPAAGSATSKAPQPIVIDRFHFKSDGESYITAASNTQLYLFDIETQKLDPLTADHKFNDSDPVWSPDGARIAYISNHDADPDRSETDRIFVIDARPGATPKELPNAYEPGGQVAWSPDGKFLAYLSGVEQKYAAYNLNRFGMISIADGVSRILTEKLDRGVSSLQFTPDGSAVNFLVIDDQHQYLAKVPVSGGKTERLSGKDFVILQRSGAAGHTAVTAASDTVAPEIFALESGELRKLTSHNDGLLAEIQLGAVEDISFKSKDGTEIHGMMVKPPDFVPSRKYATLLWIHGGPNGQTVTRSSSILILFKSSASFLPRTATLSSPSTIAAAAVAARNLRAASSPIGAIKKSQTCSPLWIMPWAWGLPTRTGWLSADGATEAYSLTISSPPTHASKRRLAAQESGTNSRCLAAINTSCNTTASCSPLGNHWTHGSRFPILFFTRIAFTHPHYSWVGKPTSTYRSLAVNRCIKRCEP
jgi:dipeptidyl aminopeptidase/acylaminoacyl peptidase